MGDSTLDMSGLWLVGAGKRLVMEGLRKPRKERKQSRTEMYFIDRDGVADLERE